MKTGTTCTRCAHASTCPAYDARMLYGFCQGYELAWKWKIKALVHRARRWLKIWGVTGALVRVGKFFEKRGAPVSLLSLIANQLAIVVSWCMSKLKMLAPRKVGVIKVGSVQAATKRVNGRPWMRLRAQALERDKGVCQACLAVGRVTLAVEVDHVVPLHRGGRDELANLQALCRECHRAKSAEEEDGRRGKW